jgi:ATP phosphoribosyltransferase regulatory subunit
MERCRKEFLSRFSSFGYRPFLPAGLQLLDIAWNRLPGSLRSRVLPVNSSHGEPCCLRADLTLAAVAYLASHHAPHERPLRLCYADKVFRASPRPEKDLEHFQIGAELLGWDGEGADAEILFLLLGTMEALGIKDYTLVLGDVKLIQEALRGLETGLASSLTEALQEGSYETYRNMIQRSGGIPKDRRDLLLALPELKGGRDVLEKARDLQGGTLPLEGLERIINTLGELGFGDRIRLDLGMARELDYYSGPIFEVYVEKTGQALGGGGRYDGLLSSYGMVGQAVGFALNLEKLASVSPSTGDGSPLLMAWCGDLSPARTLGLAQELTGLGIALELNWHSSRKISMELARLRGYRWWADLAEEKVTDLGNGQEMPLEMLCREGA